MVNSRNDYNLFILHLLHAVFIAEGEGEGEGEGGIIVYFKNIS